MIKAIETVYRGYRFRSRLEARWAVFFDALGLAYCYEHEGYDLGKLGLYLPDFWFPSLEVFGEVKPGQLNEEEFALAAALPHPCLLFDTSRPEATTYYPAGLHSIDGDDLGYAEYQTGGNYWRVLLDSSMYKARLYFVFYDTKVEDCELWGLRPAEQAALAARFEHGETP